MPLYLSVVHSFLRERAHTLMFPPSHPKSNNISDTAPAVADNSIDDIELITQLSSLSTTCNRAIATITIAINDKSIPNIFIDFNGGRGKFKWPH